MSTKKTIGKIALERRTSQNAREDSSEVTPRDAAERVRELKALSEKHGVPSIDLDQICLKLSVLEILPRDLAEKHLAIPVVARPDCLFLAAANPKELRLVDELEFVSGKKVFSYVALPEALRAVIREAYEAKARAEEYYVGPHCPEDVLRKHGLLSQEGASPTANNEQPTSPEKIAPEPMAARHPSSDTLVPEVVIDDVSDKLSRLAPDLDTDIAASALALEPIGKARRQERHILIVEDETEIRKLLCRLLSNYGYQIHEAENGQVALSTLKEKSIDLVVLDAMLPGIHGFEIARQMKSTPEYQQIPIIMVSAIYKGWRYAEDVKRTYQVQEFLEKPFRISDMLSAVERCFAESATFPAAQEASAEAEAAFRAGSEAYSSGKLDEAIAQLQRGITLDPSAFRLRFQLALLYGKKGYVYEAIRELETALELRAEFPAVKNLAILYQKAGFRNKATEMWERALSLAPDEPTRQSIKNHLLSLF